MGAVIKTVKSLTMVNFQTGEFKVPVVSFYDAQAKWSNNTRLKRLKFHAWKRDKFTMSNQAQFVCTLMAPTMMVLTMLQLRNSVARKHSSCTGPSHTLMDMELLKKELVQLLHTI